MNERKITAIVSAAAALYLTGMWLTIGYTSRLQAKCEAEAGDRWYLSCPPEYVLFSSAFWPIYWYFKSAMLVFDQQ